jgi:hypothetical protein
MWFMTTNNAAIPRMPSRPTSLARPVGGSGLTEGVVDLNAGADRADAAG